MEQSPSRLSAKDIVAIVKACNEAKVAKFEYNGLKIDYRGEDSPTVPVFETSHYSPAPDEIASNQDKPITETNRDELMYLEPERFEEMIAKGA